MRIGFDAKRLFNNFTGLGNYSRFVVKSLLDSYPDHHYTLYSPKVKPHSDTQEFRVNPKLLIRTPPRWVKGSGFGSFWRSVNLGNIALRDGMDIFHGLSNELPVSKPTGLKTVVTIHDLIFIRYPELYNRIDVTIYKKKLEHACKSADKIIAISKQSANDLQSYLSVPEEKISIIYQGCNSIFKRTSTEDDKALVRKKYELPIRYLLTVGTLEPRKNAMLILRALTRLPADVSLVLIGKETAYQKELDQFIKDNALSPRIHFIHKLTFDDLPKIYQMAEVFVYPSRFEGFGIPIVEAIHSGVPVIASTGSCLEEAGGPSGLYVDPDDDEGLALKIENLLGNQSLRKDFIEKGKIHVQKFEPEIIASQLIKSYSDLML